MKPIVHIVHEEAWQSAREKGVYQPASLQSEGFIHCSTLAQVRGVANAFYTGQAGLVLLYIDSGLVPAEIQFEDCYESGQAFPHIYGPLPVSAVVQVVPYSTGVDCQFPEPPPFIELLIREAGPADSPAMTLLLAQLGYPAGETEVTNRLERLASSDNDLVIVAVHDSRVVGLAASHIFPYFHSGEMVCRLSALVIHESYRSQGVGSRLLAAIERQALAAGCDAVELTSAERRAEAHEFYLGRGYNRAGIKFFKKLRGPAI